MKPFHLFLCVLMTALFAQAKTPALGQFTGTWALSKGAVGICPNQITISKDGTKKVTLRSQRDYSSSELTFDASTTTTTSSKDKIDKSKDKKNILEKSYTLLSNVNTSVVDNILISSHLWSSPEFKWSSTGIKTYTINSNGKLALKKVITGFMDDSSEKKLRKKTQETRHFTFVGDYNVNSSSYECEFTAAKKTASK